MFSEDIYRLFDELGKCLVTYRDIRYENILRGVPSKEGTPSTCAPGSSKETPWRIVDLADCTKHECDVDHHNLVWHRLRVEDLLDTWEGGFKSME